MSTKRSSKVSTDKQKQAPIGSTQSMTGHASLEVKLGDRSFRLVVNSVNHRYFELNLRTPRSWQNFEVEIQKLTQEKLSRGRVTLSVEATQSKNVNKNDGSLPAWIDEITRLDRLLVKKKLPKNPAVLAWILQNLVDVNSKSSEQTLDWKEVSPALSQLCDRLTRERSIEGAATLTVIRQDLRILERLEQNLRNKSASIQESWEQNYRQRILQLAQDIGTPAPDDHRLAQEYLIYADRRAVSEELDRMRMHLDACERALASGSPLGKRLDALMQELHREVTTLGNKVKDAETSHLTIEAKLAIERIREQALNLL